MTPKDYEKIAGIIRDAREARHLGRLDTVLRLQRNLTDYLKEENPDFDERRFEIACMSREPRPVLVLEQLECVQQTSTGGCTIDQRWTSPNQKESTQWHPKSSSTLVGRES